MQVHSGPCDQMPLPGPDKDWTGLTVQSSHFKNQLQEISLLYQLIKSNPKTTYAPSLQISARNLYSKGYKQSDMQLRSA